MRTETGSDQITDPGQPGERRRVGTVGDAEPSHFDQPAGEECRLGVVPEPEAVGHPGDYVIGANLAGYTKVADAMVALGVI